MNEVVLTPHLLGQDSAIMGNLFVTVYVSGASMSIPINANNMLILLLLDSQCLGYLWAFCYHINQKQNCHINSCLNNWRNYIELRDMFPHNKSH